MAWFREAKFGLWFRWGLYAIPQGVWNGQHVPGPSEWIMNNASIPVKDYAALAAQFRGNAFDAETWAKFTVDAGARYLVATAKDFDGFAMYRSAASRFNVFDATPFHRDPLQEISAACARNKLKFGIFYSLSRDWHEPNAPGNTWDFGPEAHRDFKSYLAAKVEPQLTELLTHYGPVSILQFDSGDILTQAQAQRIVALVRRLQPGAAIGGLGLAGDYRCFEADIAPGQFPQGDWQQTLTANHTGGYKDGDNDWKTTEELTFRLSDAVSRGGNLLLNVGPMADGMIPPPESGAVSSLGNWLTANGAAIYGAGPTAFGAEFGAPDSTRRDSMGRPEFTKAESWRCTTKPGEIYLHLFEWPKGVLEVSNVSARVTRAFLLADAKKAALPMTQQSDRVRIELPELPPLEGPISPRLNPVYAQRAQIGHVRVVLALETAAR